MRVSVDIEQADVEGDYGTVDGIRLTCERCGHSVEVAGTSDRSARRGAIMLREECPEEAENFYDVDGWSG